MKNTKIGKLIINSQVSLAPMAGITDYVLRSLVRRHSKSCLLTTEMISSEALVQVPETSILKRNYGAKNQSPSRHCETFDSNVEGIIPPKQSPSSLNISPFSNGLPQDAQEITSVVCCRPSTSLMSRNDVEDADHSPIAYQLSGHKPQLMARAAKMLEPYADIIDINMGCPVNKVVKGQDGCALMRNPELAFDVVRAIKAEVELPVSVKFRLGYTVNELNFVEYGVKMQEAGADFITIHGRTRSQMYSGKADWASIKELKRNVDIPVFANGDILSIESAIECLEQSNADGVAVGRGVLGDVTLIARIEHYLMTGEKLPVPSLEEKVQTLKTHLIEEMNLRREDVGIKFVRKFYPYYISGIKDAAKYRAMLVREDDYDKIIKVLDELANLKLVMQ